MPEKRLQRTRDNYKTHEKAPEPLKNGSGKCPHCGGGLQLVRDGGFVLLPTNAPSPQADGCGE